MSEGARMAEEKKTTLVLTSPIAEEVVKVSDDELVAEFKATEDAKEPHPAIPAPKKRGRPPKKKVVEKKEPEPEPEAAKDEEPAIAPSQQEKGKQPVVDDDIVQIVHVKKEPIVIEPIEVREEEQEERAVFYEPPPHYELVEKKTWLHYLYYAAYAMVGAYAAATFVNMYGAYREEVGIKKALAAFQSAEKMKMAAQAEILARRQLGDEQAGADLKSK